MHVNTSVRMLMGLAGSAARPDSRSGPAPGFHTEQQKIKQNQREWKTPRNGSSKKIQLME